MKKKTPKQNIGNNQIPEFNIIYASPNFMVSNPLGLRALVFLFADEVCERRA